MTSVSGILQQAGKHLAGYETCAVNLGFKGINGKTAAKTRDVKDRILPPTFSRNPQLSSEDKINLLKEFGGWDPESNAFPAAFDINAVIRTKDGAEVRWLDVAARTKDEDFTRFLLESGACLDLCSATTQDSLRELALDVGFQDVGPITAQDIQNAARAIRATHDSTQRIQILEDLANESSIETTETAETEITSTNNGAGFLGRLNLNATIRAQGGKEYTLLDFAAEINDKELALFLIEKDATQCSPETRTTFATEFKLDQLQRRTNTTITSPPSDVGSVTETNNIIENATSARKLSIGGYVKALLNNPMALGVVIAGGSLYGLSIAFNGMIATGYILTQGVASLATMPLYAADKALWGGINLVRTGLGYEKADTRYYLTKTLGGLACLTGLAVVAMCANTVAILPRLVLVSSAAYLGAKLISQELSQVDGISYDDHVTNLNQYFESTQPDMQRKNWEKLGTFIYKLATERGFKKHYEEVFTIPASGTNPTATVPIYGFQGVHTTFAVRIYG